MTKKRFMVPAMLVLLFFAGSPGRGLALFKTKVVFQKGSDTWVKITRPNRKLKPFLHPREFSVEDMDRVLASLRYFKPDMLSFGNKKGKEYDVFNAQERSIITAPLAEAFSRVGPDEWVDFSINSYRGKMMLGSFRLTDGVMFVKDGKLNVALRNIAVKATTGNQLNTYDPTKGYRSMTKLVATKGQKLTDDNWVVMDPDNLPAPPAPVVPVPGPQQPASSASPRPTPVVEPVQPTPQPTPVRSVPTRPVKQRLLELQDLYDEGLITEEEYKRKREDILKDL